MKKRTTAVSFRQVDSIDVALTELARQDAQRMLAAALRPETDSSPGDAEAGRSAAAENAKGDLPRAALASQYPRWYGADVHGRCAKVISGETAKGEGERVGQAAQQAQPDKQTTIAGLRPAA